MSHHNGAGANWGREGGVSGRSSKTVAIYAGKKRRVHNPTPTSARFRVLALLLLALTASCATHRHAVGLGATGTGEQSVRQYYLFFGLMTVNDISAQRMADGLTSYEIETGYNFWDWFLQPFLLPLTMTSRTVTVRT